MGKGEEKPPVHGIPHPKKRQGNKPGKNKQESYDNREEGGCSLRLDCSIRFGT